MDRQLQQDQSGLLGAPLCEGAAPDVGRPGAPPADLGRFPAFRLRPASALYRVHRRDRGPWWFSHGGAGRFDLTAPGGTCYLAGSALAAFVEAFRELALVAEGTVDGWRVSALRVPVTARLADCTRGRARAFGLAAGIGTTEDYRATQAWAAGLAAAGFAGVRYPVRHGPSRRGVGVALFGSAGEATWPVDATGPIDQALRARAARVGIRVLPAG